MNNLPFREMLPELVAIADAAGVAIMGIYANPEFQVEAKSDSSPLTAADLAANEIIVAGLARHWPHIPVLTEEANNIFGVDDAPPFYWAVDPLDGTKEFVKRNGEFTVNIALVENGRSVLGVVSAPALDWLYTGIVGEQARSRHAGVWAAIQATRPAEDLRAPTRVAQSRSHPSPEVASFLQRFESMETREVGSSLKFCLIASGEIDVYPRFGPTSIWDTAAGHAVLEAAGGSVEKLDGTPLTYPRPGAPLNPFFVAWSADHSGSAIAA